MTKVFGQDSDVHFGEAGKPLPDWRESGIDGVDPDDEELEDTPPDVTAMLGFDPKEPRG